MGLWRFPELTPFLELLLAIPLLPAELIGNAIFLMKKKIYQFDSEHHARLERFMAYIQRQWLRKADVVSVAKLSQRTNNISESFNSRIVDRMGGKKRNIWTFLGFYCYIIFLFSAKFLLILQK